MEMGLVGRSGTLVAVLGEGPGDGLRLVGR
jgi:hypothetical protein